MRIHSRIRPREKTGPFKFSSACDMLPQLTYYKADIIEVMLHSDPIFIDSS